MRVEALVGEHAGQQRADRSADAVRRNHIERIVEGGLGSELNREVAGNRRDPAEDQRVQRAHEAGRRSHRDETDDNRRRRTNRRRLPRSHRIENRPDHERARRRQHRRDERQAGNRAGRQRAAGVEAEPAEPQQARAEEHERHVVRDDRGLPVSLPLPDGDDRGQRRNGRVHVHDGAAGEVERAHVGQPATAPDPVRDRAVDDERPERDEHDVRREAHALDNRARDQRSGDDREGALEGHEERVRNRALRLEPDAIQEGVRHVAEPVTALGESASE